MSFKISFEVFKGLTSLRRERKNFPPAKTELARKSETKNHNFV